MLSKHGNNPTFIESLTPKLRESFTIVSTSDKKNQVVRLLHMISVLMRYRRQCKLILIDTYSTRNFWFSYTLAYLAFRFKIKYVPITRGGDLASRLDRSPSYCRRLFGNAYRIVSPSTFLQEEFKKRNYEVHYIPNFIPVKDYPFKKRSQFSPRLLWVRAYQKIYNPELAVGILKAVKEFNNDAHLCMIGPDKGSYADIKRIILEEGLERNITLHGKLTKAEWTRIAVDYDIFINTTNFDNRPVSVIEAMALGLLVVSTNVGGISHLIDNNIDGILVEPGKVQPFADAIGQVVQHPDRSAEIAGLARAKVEKFDWEIVKKQWFELIYGAIQ